jgi:hypothetical protein
MVNTQAWQSIHEELLQKDVTLVAVSKTKPIADVQALYELGQRDFGENYVQELVEKFEALPTDIRWHFIGHLQTNKVKYIAPFVHLIHGVDNEKLLMEINKQGAKNNRIIDVLLQVYIATEDTKFGLDDNELVELVNNYTQQLDKYSHVRICGLMGMASATDNLLQVRKEFAKLRALFVQLSQQQLLNQPAFKYCSMGMSSDYAIAIEEGSNIVRIGSLLFGKREYL